MSIERLNTAARAAGFAMATPEEEPIPERLAADSPGEPRALVPVALLTSPAKPSLAPPLATRIGTWFRGHMPSFGGRAPA